MLYNSMVHEVKNPSTERLSKQLTKAGKWIPSLFLKFCIESYRNGDVDAIDFIEKFTTEEYCDLITQPYLGSSRLSSDG